MEKITYQKLKAGYILKKDDVLDTLHGFNDLKVSSGGLWLWLHNPYETNSALYEYLGIADPKDGSGAPEFDSPEELTKHVISLFEKSPYKVGNKVRILEREKDCMDYPFSFTDEMKELAGNIFTIKKIKLSDWCLKNKYYGDFHRYVLDEPGDWNWHSSMFEKVDSEENTEEPVRQRKYSNKEMVVICGKKYRVSDSGTCSFLVGDFSVSNRQPFVDLGIIHSLDKEKELMDWIKRHRYAANHGMFPPIANEQFDDFIDLLLQMEKDQEIVCQCKSSKDSYEPGNNVRIGEDEYIISKGSRGSELVWSLSDETSELPEKLKFAKKKKNIHITL